MQLRASEREKKSREEISRLDGQGTFVFDYFAPAYVYFSTLQRFEVLIRERIFVKTHFLVWKH